MKYNTIFLSEVIIFLAFLVAIIIKLQQANETEPVPTPTPSPTISHLSEVITYIPTRPLPQDDIFFIFPAKTENAKSKFILKIPKTEASNRKIFISKQLKAELAERLQAI